MLALTRKKNEKVILRHKATGVQIVVALVDTRGAKHIRLGFDAPQDWEIIRGELLASWNVVSSPTMPAEAATA